LRGDLLRSALIVLHDNHDLLSRAVKGEAESGLHSRLGLIHALTVNSGSVYCAAVEQRFLVRLDHVSFLLDDFGRCGPARSMHVQSMPVEIENPQECDRTLSCIHCRVHFTVAASSANLDDKDVVLLGVLAAHLIVRHSTYFQSEPIPRVADVFQHFRVERTRTHVLAN
jgi:hypothetical protein